MLSLMPKNFLWPAWKISKNSTLSPSVQVKAAAAQVGESRFKLASHVLKDRHEYLLAPLASDFNCQSVNAEIIISGQLLVQDVYRTLEAIESLIL